MSRRRTQTAGEGEPAPLRRPDSLSLASRLSAFSFVPTLLCCLSMSLFVLGAVVADRTRKCLLTTTSGASRARLEFLDLESFLASSRTNLVMLSRVVLSERAHAGSDVERAELASRRAASSPARALLPCLPHRCSYRPWPPLLSTGPASPPSLALAAVRPPPCRAPGELSLTPPISSSSSGTSRRDARRAERVPLACRRRPCLQRRRQGAEGHRRL